jgi:hypothetical protein
MKTEVRCLQRSLAPWLVLCTVLLGCGTPGPRRWFTSECGDNAACGSGGLCIEQHCARACVATSDCGDGLCFHERCLPIAYACQVGFCDDGNVCSVDECNTTTGECRYSMGTSCDLGVCVSGAECIACTPGKDCAGGFQCKGPAKCDDGDPATVDTCGADGTCASSPTP